MSNTNKWVWESYDIIKTRDHYKVYINGEFYCTADNIVEAANEISKYESGEG